MFVYVYPSMDKLAFTHLISINSLNSLINFNEQIKGIFHHRNTKGIWNSMLFCTRKNVDLY